VGKRIIYGAPDWSQFEKYPYPTLSPEEQSFIDNEVEVFVACLMNGKFIIN
jgi:acyl-CoA dehydrogenase